MRRLFFRNQQRGAYRNAAYSAQARQFRGTRGVGAGGTVPHGRILRLDGTVGLPARHDIADIPDLRFETTSRVINGLEGSGVLTTMLIEGVRAAHGCAMAFSQAATP